MREIFSIVFVIIGALIGAGFASGQEMYSFFYAYGVMGLLGIIITCILISLLIYKSLKIINRKNIHDYSDFLNQFIKNKKVNKTINIILNVLLTITFFIMVAGFGAYFEQELGLNRIIGSTILAILSAIVFFTSVKGVLKVSEIIVPILILFITFIGIINIFSISENIEIIATKRGWLLSSITYCSYNVILLIPVLIPIGKQITKESNIKYIAIITGLIMTTLSILTYMLLTKLDVSDLEMPIVYVISRFFSQYKEIYAFIILSSIFTTAISVGIGVLENIGQNKKSYPQIVLILCIISILISNFGFSNLVNILYPIFGYIGIAQIILIVKTKIL